MVPGWRGRRLPGRNPQPEGSFPCGARRTLRQCGRSLGRMGGRGMLPLRLFPPARGMAGKTVRFLRILHRRFSVPFRSIPFCLRGGCSGRDPRVEVRRPSRRRGCPRFKAARGRPRKVAGSLPGRFPSDRRPRPDPAAEIFPARVQSSGAGRVGAGAPCRLAVRSTGARTNG